MASVETFNVKERRNESELEITEDPSSTMLNRGPLLPEGFKRTMLPIENDCPLGGAIIGRNTARITFLDRQRVEKGLQST